MQITRAQVNAAKEALGLDINDTRSVAIYPDHVFIETVARDGAHPVIINGQLELTHTDVPIEEAP